MVNRRKFTKVCRKYGMTLDDVLVKVLTLKEASNLTPEFIKTILCGIEDKDSKIICEYVNRLIS